MFKESNAITLEKSVVVNGRRWNLFSVEFKTPDGTYSTYIYALDHYHASVMLADLKEGAEIVGQVV